MEELIRPVITTPKGVAFDEGDLLRLVCKASRFDFQGVDWTRKDGKQLPQNRTTTDTRIEDYDMVMTLLIDSVTMDDAGVYQCLGYSENSTSPASVNINILGDDICYVDFK